VPHTFPPHLGTGYLHTALITDYTLIAYFLVFATKTLKVLGGAKNPFAEKTVPFGL
jgi:hypothetical protein